MIVKIRQYPDAILRQPTLPIGKAERESPEFLMVINDIKETTLDSIAVALSANQIGYPHNLFYINPKYLPPKLKLDGYFINPVVTGIGAKTKRREGCMSLFNGERSFYAFRNAAVRVEWESLDGKIHSAEMTGTINGISVPGVFQHEYSHLLGKFPGIITGLDKDLQERVVEVQ